MREPVDAEPGQNIADFAAELVTLAWQQNATVVGRFNQYTLEARPGMKREDVMRPWFRRSAQGVLHTIGATSDRAQGTVRLGLAVLPDRLGTGASRSSLHKIGETKRKSPPPPQGERGQVGQQQSDGSRSCPGEEDRTSEAHFRMRDPDEPNQKAPQQQHVGVRRKESGHSRLSDE